MITTPLEELLEAIRKYQAREVDPSEDDLKALRGGMDGLESEFAVMARRAQRRGDHLISGSSSAASWIGRTCNMSMNSAADRLRVGEQLDSLPKVAAALSAGEIGYQSASLLCHLREWLGENRDLFDEEGMLGYARAHSVFNLCKLCNVARQSPHHIIFWARGGPSNLPNELLLCHYHHRLVHEGGWQVIKAGRGFRFLPPERVVMRKARGPGMRWAA